MKVTHFGDDPLEILRRRLKADIKATPLCIAIIGWLCNDPTDPFVAAIELQQNQVALRLSDESALKPLCTVVEFLDQVRVICQSLHFDAAQTGYVVTRARELLE